MTSYDVVIDGNWGTFRSRRHDYESAWRLVERLRLANFYARIVKR